MLHLHAYSMQFCALILTGGLVALDRAPLEACSPRDTCVHVCLLVVSLLDY